jgi:hypothetical protein
MEVCTDLLLYNRLCTKHNENAVTKTAPQMPANVMLSESRRYGESPMPALDVVAAAVSGEVVVASAEVLEAVLDVLAGVADELVVRASGSPSRIMRNV